MYVRIKGNLSEGRLGGFVEVKVQEFAMPYGMYLAHNLSDGSYEILEGRDAGDVVWVKITTGGLGASEQQQALVTRICSALGIDWQELQAAVAKWKSQMER